MAVQFRSQKRAVCLWAGLPSIYPEKKISDVFPSVFVCGVTVSKDNNSVAPSDFASSFTAVWGSSLNYSLPRSSEDSKNQRMLNITFRTIIYG